MIITSPAFENSQPIPVKYSCKGSDVSPALDNSLNLGPGANKKRYRE